MIHYHLTKLKSLPLVIASRKRCSLVLGTFPAAYKQYLRDGTHDATSSFLIVEEFGMFQMQDTHGLKALFVIIVALNLKLQGLGAAHAA